MSSNFTVWWSGTSDLQLTSETYIEKETWFGVLPLDLQDHDVNLLRNKYDFSSSSFKKGKDHRGSPYNVCLWEVN